MNNRFRQLQDRSPDLPLTQAEKWKFRAACLLILGTLAILVILPPLGFLIAFYLVLGDVPSSREARDEDDDENVQLRPLFFYWGRWFGLGFRPQWSSTKHIVPALGVLYFATVIVGGLLFRYTGQGPYTAHKLLEGLQEIWVLYACLALFYVNKHRERLFPGLPSGVLYRIALILMFGLMCAYMFFQIEDIGGGVP